MTAKELKKLNRSELLQMLIIQIEENESLKVKLQNLQEQQQNRQIQMESAGNIAEAALKLNGIFEAAQEAAGQYLENIQRLSEEQEVICKERKEEAQSRRDAILQEAQKNADTMLKEAQKNADSMLEEAQKNAAAYWDEIYDRAQALLHAQDNLRSLIETRKGL